MNAAARTRQEIFDLAWNGLKAQGFQKSTSVDGGCAYRGSDSIRCAIGHCIPDELYSPSFEGQSADCFYILEAAGVSEDDAEFVTLLQGRHDEAIDPANMEARLRAFADRHGLTIPSEAA